MKAVFLPTNQCWAVMFGDTLTSVDGRTLFNTKAELIDTLAGVGLSLDLNNNIKGAENEH